MDGPLGLAQYLTDAWLRDRTGTEPAGRDPAQEHEQASRYLAAQPEAWQALVVRHARALPPMAPGTRLVVFLIAENEAGLIGQCLAALSADLDSSGLRDDAEIVVVRLQRADVEPDDTAARVREHIRTRPGSAVVHLLEPRWPAGCTTFLALSRKLAVDVTAQRAVSAGLARPLYLVTEDADVEWVERRRAGYVVTTFDASPQLDVLRGWHLRSLSLLEYLPLFVERLTWRACERALSNEKLRPEHGRRYSFAWNRVVTAGWNVAFTLHAYVLAGGYTTTVELFEDMDLGQRISVLRGTSHLGRFIPGTRTMAWMPFESCSDGRRALNALAGNADLYGAIPSVAGFVAATAHARTWPMDAAVLTARGPWRADAISGVLARRRAEVAAILGDGEALDFVMRAAADSLGVADSGDLDGLRARQRVFLEAARAVAAGAESAGYSAELGRPSGSVAGASR